jgi:hypothetical protein
MKRSISLFAVALLAMGLWTMPAAAAGKIKESYCSLIRETPDGKFRYESKFGWSLLAEEEKDGVIAFPDDVTAIACLRTPLLLQVADLETLQQGISLSFSASAINIIGFEMVDGKIKWSVKTGNFDAKVLAAIGKSVEKVQAQVK